jgi:hypothetical protein
MFVRVTVVAVVVALALSMSGCAQVSGLLASGPDMASAEATVAIPAAPLNGELPSGAPRELPLWPGASVVEGASTEATYDVILSVADLFADVVAGTAKGFKDAGWQVTQESLDQETARIVALNVSRATHEGLITITPGEAGETVISYVISAVE